MYPKELIQQIYVTIIVVIIAGQEEVILTYLNCCVS